NVATLSRQLRWTIDRCEFNELRFRSRLRLVDEGFQWESDPRNDHRPAFDTSMAVNALLERSDLQQRVEVVLLRLPHQAFDAHRPRLRMETASQFRRTFFVHRELVEVVVVRDVL